MGFEELWADRGTIKIDFKIFEKIGKNQKIMV
jgi:hypothetical protein